MYCINKIVGWCLSPLGVGLTLMALSFFAIRFPRWTGIGRFILAFSFFWLWFFSCAFVTPWIGLALEGDECDLATLPSAEAIVLLGGGMDFHEKCGRPEMNSGADRVWAAARLFRDGKAPMMTVSGGAARGEIAFLSDMGVDTNRIVILDKARNTEEEAKLIAQAIRERRAGGGERAARILLVTSAWHMPRAKRLFERAGFEVVAAPTDYESHARAEATARPGIFFPTADALNRNSYLVKEWVARFCYWLKGV